MAIVVSKLVSAAMLQDFIIGKNAQPLAAGVITMYEDANHTLLKNWYYQTGVPGNFVYAALPNPMTLSASGTMIDVNGNDIIPFYYPWNENDSDLPQPYFVTVYDQFGTLQFTRSNFPFVPTEAPSPTTAVPTFENYVINNRFWRNIGSLSAGTLANTWTLQYNSMGTVYYATLAPDQHDGFTMPDINYIKNINGSSTETITFNTFPTQQDPVLEDDVQPEYYITHNCTADTSGSSLKAYQFPISLHLATLSCQPFSFSLQGQSISGSDVISVYIYTFCGTGVPSPAPSLLGQITLTTSWEKFDLTGTFPATLGLTLGAGGDDAYYLQINMPSGSSAICNLNFTLPSIYLSDETQIPTNSFSTYDQIDTVVNSARTGDIRTSINSFQPYGWVAMNDGSIGSASSSATSRANIDTWPLYNLIYTTVLNNWAPVSGGRTAPGNTITTAYADFTANKRLTLPRSLGRVLAGENAFTTTPQTFTTNYGASHFNLTVASSTEFATGSPVQLTNTGGALPSSLSANTVYFAININATTIQLAATVENAYVPTPIDIGSDSTGTSTVQWALGAYVGESLHTLVTSELPNTLGTGIGVTNVTPAGATSVIRDGVTGGGSIVQTAGNHGHNTIQPTTYMNVFVKL